KSIAVLPFTNMSSEPEIEYFGDGIAEEIINALARLPGLRVAGRSSAFSFKGKREDVRVIGDKLAVASVLEGSVRKAGAQLRITAQLVNVADGYDLWSERFDRGPEDVFAIQEEIARTIADRLQVSLTGSAERTLLRPHTENLEAYHLYLKGRGFLYKRGVAIWHALEAFRAALELEMEPLAAYPRSMFALALSGSRRHHEAVDQARRAVALDPDAYLSQIVLAAAYHGAGRLEDALAVYEPALAISGRHPWGVAGQAVVYADWGKRDEARAIRDELVRRSQQEYVQPTALAMVAAAVGARDEALALLHRACDEHDPFLIFTLYGYPTTARLREDPRFAEIRERMGLPSPL